MKRIWFVSHYSMPPQYEMRIKTQMYAHHLNLMGYETKIFTSSIIHNTQIDLIEGNELYVERKYDDLDFVHIKCRKYYGNGINRILNMQEFAYRFPKVAKKFPLPDVVVADANCTNYYPIYKFCKKHSIPIYIDMRDLWPMSIVEYYKKFTEKNLIIKYLYHRERIMYRNVTGVIFAMPGGKDYIKDKQWNELDLNKFYYINNGVDIAQFNEDIKSQAFVDADLDDDSVFKIVYTGSIRIANNIQSLVDAARILKERGNTKVKFLVYGDGDERPSLEQQSKDACLTNIVFKGTVPKKKIPYIMSKCNAAVLNYQKAKTLKYGGSQNKFFEYMAAGLPILMTVEMNYNLITEHNIGITIDSPEGTKIANAVEQLSSLSKEELTEMSNRAKTVAQDYDFKSLTKKLLSIILK
jgi:glycosyltransferase involved in cell wall biosynthesis